ncbi:hypothetical protein KFJ24_12590 [Marinobacter sediminum]|uniref:tetratricopeptide repeat protein n=1 Tax=Marinobacter sediminum TaxID=256323 RepID=UPI00202FF055|nr:hypothetical protein [Marinobacter sediminum]MCM0613312.1 hypothetical protein [Marinobacter sediminum]
MMFARAAHRTLRDAFAGLVLGAVCLPASAAPSVTEVHDLKYGAILFEFYQQNYFEALVEYAWAEGHGGIQNHGTYPELLKGGISLSYGLDNQAEEIFSRVARGNLTEEVRNRAWFYLGKMQYLRGDTSVAARNLGNIQGPLPEAVDSEYRYLAALVNVKLGYFSAGEAVADSIDSDSPFAPYFYFNLAIAFGSQENSGRAIAALEKVIDLNDGSEELQRLADRARMALSFLYAGRDNQASAGLQLSRISSTGAYSNRGLLGASWMAINERDFRDALGPLDVLTKRSIALPEVQEAILLQPHVYEQMGLNGRAAQGFIDADHKFRNALDWLQKARQSMDHADVMELFVRNLDQVLDESDWFGAAPSVSVNHLSPFLVELMSDHSFQSVLKDLRDLYAIRNNLESWQARRDDFDVILAARAASVDGESYRQGLSRLARQLTESRQRYQALSGRMTSLAPDAQERLRWQLEDLAFDITRGENMLEALAGTHTISGGDQFSQAVSHMMAQVDDQMVRTEGLITRLEDVMRTLVATELDIHEQRLKQYQVEAQLAKVRILDRSLQNLDGTEDDGQSAPESAAASADQAEGDDHAI